MNHRSIMVRSCLIWVLFSLSILVSSGAHAGWCVVQNPFWSQTYSWSTMPISVSDKDPVGTVLATIEGHPEAQWGGFVTASGNLLASCTIGWWVDGATPAGGTWTTNVPGIGLRVSYGGTPVNAPGSQNLSFFGPQDFVRQAMKLELIKTGNITSASTLGQIVYYYNCDGCLPGGQNGGGGPGVYSGLVLVANGIQIQPAAPTCSLSTASATFNMGTLKTSDFNQGAGATYNWVADQSLRASGTCSASTASMTFAGTADPTYPNAFKNNGSATGVAMQLWQSNGSQAIPNSSTPIRFAAGANQNFTFSARYIQTAPTVNAGSVSATVTATVNYQ